MNPIPNPLGQIHWSLQVDFKTGKDVYGNCVDLTLEAIKEKAKN